MRQAQELCQQPLLELSPILDVYIRNSIPKYKWALE